MKRVLSVILAAAMLFSVFAVSAFAAVTISANPAKTVYTVGDFFDPYGLKVKDGRRNISYSSATINNFTFEPTLETPLTLADTAVKVYYEGEYAGEVAISVYGILQEPAKKIYNPGEFFDPTGLKISCGGEEINYTAGNTDFAFTPSLTTALTTYDKTVKITYERVPIATINIAVNSVIHYPAKVVYTVGEKIDGEGLEVSYNGSAISYPAPGFSFEPAADAALTLTDNTVAVYYDGARLGEYNITVEGLITGPAASSVTEGEVLDPTGISTKFNGVTVNYEDDPANFTFSPSLDTPAELITDDVGNILPASYTVYYKGYKVGSFEISVVVFSFALNEDGNSYSFVRCDPSVSGAVTIPAVYNDKPVTAIGDSAFYDCSSLTSVTIPDSVTSMGWGAFFGCSEAMVIYSTPNAYARTYADNNGILWEDVCKHLHTENYATSTAQSCSQPGYSAGVFCLDCNRWLSGHEITETIPHTDSNCDYVCDKCSDWVCDIIPDATKEITVEAGKTTLLKFTPYKTEFYEFTSDSENDTYGYLYDSDMNSITNDCFSGDNGNFKIKYTLEAGKTYYFGARFYNEYDSGSFNVSLAIGSPFTYTLNEDGRSYTLMECDQSYSGEVSIPETYNGKPVTSIGDYAFYGCSRLASIEIPDSVTSIGEGAFEGCYSLCPFIPSTVTEFGGDIGELIEVEKGSPAEEYALENGIYYTVRCNHTFANGVCQRCNIHQYADEADSQFEYIEAEELAFIGIEAEGWVYIVEESDCAELIIPETHQGKPVVGVAISCCPNVETIVAPKDCVVIELGVCGVKEVSLLNPDNVVVMPDDVLPRLEKITVQSSAVVYTPEYSSEYLGMSLARYFNMSENKENGVLYIGNSVVGVEWDYVKGVPLISGAVTVRPGTLNIGFGAFYECADITSVILPGSVTSIGYDAFSGCSRLASIEIPDSVTSIGYDAFSGCSRLASIEIPDSVTSIGCGAFEDTAYYNNTANWENGVLYIGDYLIAANPELSGDYRIKDGTKCIADGAFSGYSSLTSVTIPDSAANVGEGTFAGFSSLTSINVTAGNNCYSSQDGVLFNKDKTVLICCPAGKSGQYTVPGSVTSIAEGAFSGCSSLTSVTIPDGVTSIGYEAFYECSSLMSVTIPDSVTSIGYRAFADCSSLTSIEIPDSVTSIGSYAFSYCSSLASINVAEDNECYSSQNGVLFNKDKTELICCPGAKTGAYTIPSGVTSIGNSAFYNCSNLTSVTIPDSATTSIGNRAFEDCSSLTSVTIGNSVTSIGNCAFEDCSSLTSVNIPDSVTSIGARAFYNCSSLTSVTIPGRVTSIGSYAFVGCSKNLVLYGFSDSTAESYASDNSITFRAVNILPKQFEKIDYANKCIFSGKSIESLKNCLVCNTNIALECVKSSFGFIGTGTIVNVKSGDTVIDTYTMVINGDLDGDGVSDVLDAVLAERALHGCGELSAAQAYAANNSADTEIDAESYQNVVNRALGA